VTASNVEINNGIGVFDDVVSPETCQGLITLYEARTTLKKPTIVRNNLQIRDESQFYAYDPHDPNSPRADCLINSDDTSLYRSVINAFWEDCYSQYVQAYPILEGLARHSIGYVKLQKTRPSGGYHAWHCEHGTAMAGRRLGFFVLYLNTITEGGETEFLYQSCRVQAVEGRMVVAPSSFIYTHRGNPPLKTDKYVVTGWMEFQE